MGDGDGYGYVDLVEGGDDLVGVLGEGQSPSVWISARGRPGARSGYDDNDYATIGHADARSYSPRAALTCGMCVSAQDLMAAISGINVRPSGVRS